jgi:hypothetical protein
MKKLKVVKNMDRGAMSLSREHTFVFGITYTDGFLDNNQQEILECCDILDKIGMLDGKQLTATFDKAFLRRMIHSHIVKLREMDNK